jgi:peptidoglycan/LPS O-acetylase OafA/YrhL
VRISVAVLAAICLAVLAWRCWLASHGGSEAWITMATDTRIDAILAGCILALVANPWLDPPAARKPMRDRAIAAACVALLFATLAVRNEFFRDTLRYTLQSLAIAPLIWLAVARHDQPLFRWLDAAPMVYLGKVSYTIYLCHHLILCAIGKQLPGAGWLATAALGALLTLAIAEPMRRFVDEPCARLRKGLHRREPAPRVLIAETVS